jgi:hypothetical protein
MTQPILCFGQQPCGIFPRRFLFAKFQTARRLQRELGGEIVFFFHDSDHDPRETQTGLRHRKTGDVHWVNFAFENKIQRKYSPLYLKRIPAGWQEKLARQLPAYVDKPLADAFSAIRASTVADFCLEMYRALGLLEGVRVVRSSDPQVRAAACDITDRFADVPYEGEIVRARMSDGQLLLHEGGTAFQTLPLVAVEKRQISPSRDSRLGWMQSVIGCTHYIAGAGEQAYLKCEEAPEITFIARDTIDRSDEAWVDGLPATS